MVAVLVGGGIVVVSYLTLSGDEEQDSDTDETPSTPSVTTSIPEVPIGPGGQQGTPPGGMDPNQPYEPPPTNIPIVPDN